MVEEKNKSLNNRKNRENGPFCGCWDPSSDGSLW